MTTLKEFTIAEVLQHKSSSDVFVIIHDNVYDLTKFQKEVSELNYFHVSVNL